MPALAPIPPTLLRRILEMDGYKTVAEDALNWVLVRQVADELPVILPKIGKLVAVDVLMNALDRAQMNNARYFELREIANADATFGEMPPSVN
jgi:hypothetical protein